MKYEIEIEDDLLAELHTLAVSMKTDTDTLISACLKSKLLADDVFEGTIAQSRERQNG